MSWLNLSGTVPREKPMVKTRTGALILAAGYSSRMAGFKPLLEIGGKTLLEHAVGLFKNAGVDEIVTVLGHRSADLLPVVEAACSRHVLNSNFHNGMFSSIQVGVKELKNACEAFFLLPVDIPFVRPATLRQLQDAFNKNSSALVCYPQYKSRRGHPPLIDSCLINEILAAAGTENMRSLLKKYEKKAVTVAVADPFVRMDADTPEDFLLLQKAMENN